MKVQSDAYGALEFKANGDIFESQVALGEQTVAIEIEGAEDEIAGVVGRLSEFVTSFRTALDANLVDADADCGVAMYLEHLLEEADSQRLKELCLGKTPTTEMLFGLLVPYDIRFNLAEPDVYCQFDVGIANDVSDYLVCVTLDSDCKAQDVSVES